MRAKRTGRFEDKFARGEGCWLWSAHLNPATGYGMFRFNGRPTGAHRVAWMREYGPIPKAMFVCHKCDVRACVRPDHLFLGTAADNNADGLAKGRMGERKTTLRQRREIVRLYESGVRQCEIARALSVDVKLVYNNIFKHRHATHP